MKWAWWKDSDTAEEALKDLCVSFWRIGRDGAMQPRGLMDGAHT